METQSIISSVNPGGLALHTSMTREIKNFDGAVTDEYEHFLQQLRLPWLSDLLSKLTTIAGKQSFLVSMNNKYRNVATESIAYFCIKYESVMMMCFDKQEYLLNHSLDQIQNLLPEKQFYRLNRQYLINFSAIKEVEHYFARKLLVNSLIPTRDKLIVSKEKVTGFLQWLDNR
jgi:two-component system, LytTR family, response regulator LytT